MKRLISISLLLTSFCLNAQQTFKQLQVFVDREYIILPAIDLTDAEILDTSLLVVNYTFTYQKEKWTKRIKKDLPVTLSVGKIWSKFHPDIFQKTDEKRTTESLPYTVVSPRIWTVYSNAIDGKSFSEHRIPFSSGDMIFYPDNIPCPQWQFSGNETTILGYTCKEATSTFRGRVWQVWYTEEIPLYTNLWNFRGLPGLILRAETDQFHFECTAISQAQEPILRPRMKMKTMTRKKWRTFERQYCERPYYMFNNNGSISFYEGSYELNEHNWTIEYNPIELE